MSFVRVAGTGDVGEGVTLRVEVDGKAVCLVKRDGKVYAVDDVCTHEYAEMSEGFVEDHTIECPRHGSQFDIRTGKVLSMPATEDLPTFEVRVEGDDLLVDVGE